MTSSKPSSSADHGGQPEDADSSSHQPALSSNSSLTSSISDALSSNSIASSKSSASNVALDLQNSADASTLLAVSSTSSDSQITQNPTGDVSSESIASITSSPAPGSIIEPSVENGCDGCFIDWGYQPLSFPDSIAIQNITATILTYITEYDDGPVTSLETVSDEAISVNGSTLAVSDTLTWETYGLTL